MARCLAYHFFYEGRPRSTMCDAIRQTDENPLYMANDMMVWNIT